MLRLVQRINELFKDTPLWGLISHARLIVQRINDSTSPWFVKIAADIMGSYHLKYLLPATAQPWPNATVCGEAKTLAEAEHYLLIAMRECGGWASNSELAGLLASYERGS